MKTVKHDGCSTATSQLSAIMQTGRHLMWHLHDVVGVPLKDLSTRPPLQVSKAAQQADAA